jgi:BolA protein
MSHSLQDILEAKLRAGLSPDHLQVVNESHNHSRPGTDTHFRLVVVAGAFDNLRLPQRHRAVYQLLDAEIKGGIHALTMHTFTPDEWRERGESVVPSPNCRGGSKADPA